MKLRYCGIIIKPFQNEGNCVLEEIVPQFAQLPVPATVYVGFSEQFTTPMTLLKAKAAGKGRWICSFAGVQSPEAAERLREQAVFADEQLLRSDATSYFDDEIIGCSVIDKQTETSLGTIAEIWHMPANDVWAVHKDGMELPLPVIDEVILSVDIERKLITVRLLDGLLDIAQPIMPDETT